jgi:hypothetical protein
MDNLLTCINCGDIYDPEKHSPFNDFNCSFHPREPISIGNTGPRNDYAELWNFPCCGKRVVGKISYEGRDIVPNRTPGCVNGFHTTNPVKTFISYSRTDSKFANFLESELQRRGYSLWRDQTDIIAGQNWEKMINRAIEICSHFIIILSPNSINSQEVKRELSVAINLSRPIIPILIADCEIPSEISRINYINWIELQDYAYSSNFERLRQIFALNLKIVE